MSERRRSPRLAKKNRPVYNEAFMIRRPIEIIESDNQNANKFNDNNGNNKSSSNLFNKFQKNENKSAFFIDTHARLGVRDSSMNHVRTGLKIVLLLLTLVVLYWQLFIDGSETETETLTFSSSPRYNTCFLFAVVFVARVILQMVFFWNRSISWIEVFAEAGGIIPVSLCSLAYGAKLSGTSIDSITLCIGNVLFFAGTYLNIYPEYQRYVWKLGDNRKGRLYTGGHFAYCRHINYFGEILSFVGYGLVSAWWGQWVPIVMGTGMAIFSVPEIEFYLERKYSEEWKAYVQQVPCVMFPGIW